MLLFSTSQSLVFFSKSIREHSHRCPAVRTKNQHRTSRWRGRASKNFNDNLMYSSRVYKTSKDARYVLCGLLKLGIYCCMEKGRRRGLRNIKSNPESIRHAGMVSSVSAFSAVARTGWGVYKLLFRSSVSSIIHLKTLSYLPKTLSRIIHGAFVGLTKKCVVHIHVAALRWGLQQRKERKPRK